MKTAENRNPGDPDARSFVERTIRVDQAGEYGATRIYAGQLAVMGDRHPMAREIAHMAEQEERHRKFFDAMIARSIADVTTLTTETPQGPAAYAGIHTVHLAGKTVWWTPFYQSIRV